MYTYTIVIRSIKQLSQPDRLHVIIHAKHIVFHFLDGFRGSDELVVVIVHKLLHLPVQCLQIF